MVQTTLGMRCSKSYPLIIYAVVTRNTAMLLYILAAVFCYVFSYIFYIFTKTAYYEAHQLCKTRI